MKYAVVIATLIMSTTILADTPLPPPESYEAFSPNKQYVAAMNLEDQIVTVSKVGENGRRTELWKMHGWFRFASLSNDGRYIAIPYGGSNLLSTNYRKNEVMLKIVDQGKLVTVVRLDELIDDFASLKQTASHYLWGSFRGFNDQNEYVLETVENKRCYIAPNRPEIRKETVRNN